VYRRRRLGVLLAIVAAAGFLYASGAGAGTAPDSYTVASGDTLWKVATEHYPTSDDPRAKVEAIRQENELEGYKIQPGMRLELPR
jgi:LysM repeat protein